MTLRSLMIIATGLSMTGTILADGSYQKTTQVTGGPSIPPGLMALTARFMPSAKHVRDPNTEIVMVHGNRMISVTMAGSTIYDMDKGTVTTTVNANRQYSVMTFQQLEEMGKKFMNEVPAKPLAPAPKKSNPDEMQVSIESSPVTIQNTGAVRQFSGVTAKETILTLKVTMKTTDPKTGESGTSESLCYLDVWKADHAPGYDDVQDFYRRLGEKMGNKAESQKMAAAFASRPEAGGMSNLRSAANKIKGITVLEVERVSTLIGGQPLLPDLGSNQQSPKPPDQPASGSAGQNSNADAGKLGSIGSILGKSMPGLFGRKPAKPSSAPAEAQNSPGSQPQKQPPGVLSETTTQLSNFSNEPVVLSEFEVPAGYKEVPSPILQMLK